MVSVPLIVLMLKAQADVEVEKGLSGNAIEYVLHLIEHLAFIAVSHGAPTTPEYWQAVVDDLEDFAEQVDSLPDDEPCGSTIN